MDNFKVVKVADESYSYEGSLGAYENGELILGEFVEVVVVDGVATLLQDSERVVLLNDNEKVVVING